MPEQIKEIVGAVSAALCFLWMVYTEFRLRQAQSANEVMRRQLNDSKIESAIKALPDDGLLTELRKDTSG